MRYSLLLGLCALLCGCNMAMSDHPLLSGEQRSPLKLKDGLWAATTPNCKVDSRRPVLEWPGCAIWLAIKSEKIIGAKDAKPDEMPIDFVITDGTPPIVEFPLKGEGEKQAKDYAYIVIQPAAPDSNGYMVEVQGWFVACGVEAPGDRNAGTTTEKIKHFPGMDKNCHPESVGALREAATAGPQGPDKPFRLRWIRAIAN